jgi:hypothetical protein
MKRKIFFLIILLLSILINLTTKSQSLKIGLRYEPGILFVEQNNKGDILPAIFSISGNILVEPLEWFNIEVRPGMLFISEEYSGFDIGLFARLKILPTRFYLITGLNNHSNKGSVHNSAGGYDIEMLFKSIGIGYQFGHKFNIDIMYYWTTDKNYAYTRETDWLTYSRIINKQMNGILKIGFNLSWDIL